MRLESLRFRGFGPFTDEVLIDLAALGDARLVALVGSNGAGKSTALELFGAGLHRRCATRGSLADLATARDSFLELRVVNGAEYTLRHLVDAVSKKSEAVVLDATGSPVLADAKVRSFDAWADAHLPSPSVFYTSTFAAQGSGGFLELSPGDRKKCLLKILGIEHLERLAEAARERVREAKARLTTAEARLADERGRAGDPDALRGRVDELRIVASDYEGSLATYRLLLADAEAAAADATALLRDHERRRLEAADLRKRAADAETSAAAKRAEAAKLEDRIANNRRVLDRADEIRAAVGRDAELAVGLAAIEQEAAVLVARRAEPQARQRQAAQDVAKARADLAAARQRLTELQKLTAQLAAAGVLDAALNVDRRRSDVERDTSALAEIDNRLEDARGQRIAGAEERIVGLRGGLEAIATEDVDPIEQAERTLTEDDALVKDAAELPKRLAALNEERKVVADRLATERAGLATTERLAARKPEYDRAEAQRGPAMAEVDAAERAVQVAESVAAEAQEALTAIDAEAGTLGARRGKILDERAALAPLLKLAEPLTQAETRLEELTPQLAAAVAAVEVSAREAETLRARAAEVDPGEAPKAPDLDAARAKVVSAEKAARDAHASVAVAERQLEEALASATRVLELEGQRTAVLDELADWTRLADDLGKNGLQALEVDAAGPELTELANDLLHEAFGPRFTIAIDTTRTAADGRELEACEVRVLDTEKGREGTAETFSGGERVVIGEAISLALSMVACRRAGIERPTLVRDESGAALDPVNGRAYVAMLRRAVDLIGADQCLYVSHTPELQELADVRIHVEGGKVVVR